MAGGKMSKQVKCWLAVQFRMRVGQGGWLPPGSANVMRGKVTLTIHRTRSGTIHVTKRVGRDDADHGDTAEFEVHKTDKGELQAVDVTVPIMLDAKRFEECRFDEADYQRAIEKAKESLLRQFSDTSFWRNPND
jgi:hypothetical protein